MRSNKTMKKTKSLFKAVKEQSSERTFLFGMDFEFCKVADLLQAQKGNLTQEEIKKPRKHNMAL